MTETGRYYTIALNWKTITNDEVAELKAYFTEKTGINGIKLSCVKEWRMGTFIDIYGFEDKETSAKYHYRISKDDFITNASHEDG